MHISFGWEEYVSMHGIEIYGSNHRKNREDGIGIARANRNIVAHGKK